MINMLKDPAKGIEKGKTIILALNTGMVICGELIGTNEHQVILKRPALIQTRPTVKEGKTMMNLVFSLILPDTACNYKTRFAAFCQSSIMSVELVADDVQKSYEGFCTQVDESVFAHTMSEEQIKSQEDFYNNY